MKPNNKFKAVFNPITKEIAVLYLGYIVSHTFTSLEDSYGLEPFQYSEVWLDIKIDYDERFQISIYPRVGNSEELNEGLSATWTSDKLSNSRKIKIVYNNKDFMTECEKLEGFVTEYSDYSNICLY
jgi:hypothetical protein